MGTKKGQRRKTSRRAYETKSGKSLIKQTERKKKFSKKNLKKGRKVGGIFGNMIEIGYIWE